MRCEKTQDSETSVISIGDPRSRSRLVLGLSHWAYKHVGYPPPAPLGRLHHMCIANFVLWLHCVVSVQCLYGTPASRQLNSGLPVSVCAT